MATTHLRIGYQHYEGCGLHRFETLEGALRDGARLLELSFLFEDPGDLSREEAVSLGRKAAEAQLRLQIHAPIDLDAVGDPPFASTIAVAELMGADRITVHLSTLREIDGDFPWKEAVRIGALVGIENVYPDMAAPADVLAFLEGLPLEAPAGMTFDMGHANMGGLEPIEVAQRIIPRLCEIDREIVNVHVHDNLGTGDDHLVPGEGNIDFARLLPILRDAGAERFVIERWIGRRQALGRVSSWLPVHPSESINHAADMTEGGRPS